MDALQQILLLIIVFLQPYNDCIVSNYYPLCIVIFRKPFWTWTWSSSSITSHIAIWIYEKLKRFVSCSILSRAPRTFGCAKRMLSTETFYWYNVSKFGLSTAGNLAYWRPKGFLYWRNWTADTCTRHSRWRDILILPHLNILNILITYRVFQFTVPAISMSQNW